MPVRVRDPSRCRCTPQSTIHELGGKAGHVPVALNGDGILYRCALLRRVAVPVPRVEQRVGLLDPCERVFINVDLPVRADLQQCHTPIPAQPMHALSP